MTHSNPTDTDNELPLPQSMSYWEVIAELDASYFVLEQMVKQSKSRAPIERMVDQATGFDSNVLEDAKAIIARVKDLQAVLPADDPHFKKEAA